MRTVTYGFGENKTTHEYDENAPCIVCGEPVISASMGGTVLCPACDLGKCRYCGMVVFVLRKEVDNGKSKKAFLNHMKWHHEHTPEIVEKVNDGARKFNEAFDKNMKPKKEKK